MRVTLDEDVVVGFSRTGVEVGGIPPGIGLERLRWDGSRLVDLATLSEIWVRRRNGVWSLHAVEVPGSQLVSMRYGDRRLLANNGGTYRIMSPEEVALQVMTAEEELQDAVSSRAAVGEFVGNLTYARVNEHVDQVFGGLSAAQRTSLKLLYRIVLWLAKRAR